MPLGRFRLTALGAFQSGRTWKWWFSETSIRRYILIASERSCLSWMRRSLIIAFLTDQGALTLRFRATTYTCYSVYCSRGLARASGVVWLISYIYYILYWCAVGSKIWGLTAACRLRLSLYSWFFLLGGHLQAPVNDTPVSGAFSSRDLSAEECSRRRVRSMAPKHKRQPQLRKLVQVVEVSWRP